MQYSKIDPWRSNTLAIVAVLTVVSISAAARAADDADSAKQQGPRPTLVRIDTITQQIVQDRWDVVGRLREVRQSVVAAELSGKIVQVQIDEGDPVTGGETVLARIDNIWSHLDLKEAEARVAQTKAQIVAAEADLRRADRDVQYLEELGKQGSARPKEVRDARDVLHAARAILDRTKAVLVAAQVVHRRAEERVDRLAIRAPFDGVVIKKMVEVGQWVEEGTAVAEIISSGAIDAVIDVPERLINHVKINDQIEVVVEALSMMVQGKVVAIIPRGSSTARTFPVKARLDDHNGQFKAGMSVLAKVPAGKSQQALLVPRDAIHRSPKGTVVWAEISGRAHPLPVKVLFGQGERYAVSASVGGSGPALSPNMHVVVEGAERLQFPGQPVRIDESPVISDQ